MKYLTIIAFLILSLVSQGQSDRESDHGEAKFRQPSRAWLPIDYQLFNDDTEIWSFDDPTLKVSTHKLLSKIESTILKKTFADEEGTLYEFQPIYQEVDTNDRIGILFEDRLIQGRRFSQLNVWYDQIHDKSIRERIDQLTLENGIKLECKVIYIFLGPAIYKQDLTVEQVKSFTINNAISPALSADLSAYPNPNAGSFKLKLRNKKIKGVEIHSLDGKKLFFSEFEPNTEIELSARFLSDGLYVVRVYADNGSIYIKNISIVKP